MIIMNIICIYVYILKKLVYEKTSAEAKQTNPPPLHRNLPNMQSIDQ